MRYHVIYLHNGERTVCDLEAGDAATAVAKVAHSCGPRVSSFELLSVMLDAGTVGRDEPSLTAVSAPNHV